MLHHTDETVMCPAHTAAKPRKFEGFTRWSPRNFRGESLARETKALHHDVWLPVADRRPHGRHTQHLLRLGQGRAAGSWRTDRRGELPRFSTAPKWRAGKPPAAGRLRRRARVTPGDSRRA